MLNIGIFEFIISFRLCEPFFLDTGTCLVGEQVDEAAELFRDSAGSHHSARDILILHYHPAVCRFSHVQIHPQAKHVYIKALVC